TSRPHREERLRLVHRLLAFSRRTGCQVTLLSGDVHVGAVSTITQSGGPQSESVQITQLISSALVNAPPPASALFFLNRVLSQQESIDDGIRGAMSTFQNGSETFVARRNWLSLEPDVHGRIWAKLFVEQERDPLLRVIQVRGGV
ncbi:MAG: alkaline phosphatase family protein, partial [Planctomyces sp.]